MVRINRYRVIYAVPTASGNESEKWLEFEGDEKKKSVLEKIKKLNYRLVSCDKLYPFSMLKNGHNIELAYNNQHIICWEMEQGEREWDDKAFELLEDISEVYGHAIGNAIYWCPYKEWAKLTEWSAWAECHRATVNALARENGYCEA